jgi:hypothetical protein
MRVANLSSDSYIKVGILYFKPADTHDPETVMTAMRSDLVNGMGFTCPCNTKKRAEEIDMRLRQEFPGSSIK